ncbi:MAG: amidohydrolase family protein [Halobacteriales archaeon]|nr:amidohydrolase family protein [Halobacteriales archaeon]
MSKSLVVRGGYVADADGTRRADVLTRDGEITAVGKNIEADAEEVIDASGAYVAPGLVDAHVHLVSDGRPDPKGDHRESDATLSYRAARAMEDLLHAGVTTVRDLNAPNSVAIDAGRAVKNGILEGPRVFACGEAITMTGGHFHQMAREADGPVDCRKAAREQLKRGASVVKLMACGSTIWDDVQAAPELTYEEMRAIVEAAHAKDVPVAAHAPGTEAMKDAVRAGVDSVEHADFMDEEAARMIAENDVSWVPTAKALHEFVERGPSNGFADVYVERARRTRESAEDAFELALENDVTVAMGTDAGTAFNYHGENAVELELMVERGMSPADALEAATANAAELVGVNAGKVEEGRYADLVVLPRDPNEDVSAWKQPLAVVKDGKLVHQNR